MPQKRDWLPLAASVIVLAMAAALYLFNGTIIQAQKSEGVAYGYSKGIAAAKADNATTYQQGYQAALNDMAKGLA